MKKKAVKCRICNVHQEYKITIKYVALTFALPFTGSSNSLKKPSESLSICETIPGDREKKYT